MRAAWYEKQGPARQVLTVGEMPDPHPAAGEVRIRIAASGINPGDIKKRQDAFGHRGAEVTSRAKLPSICMKFPAENLLLRTTAIAPQRTSTNVS